MKEVTNIQANYYRNDSKNGADRIPGIINSPCISENVIGETTSTLSNSDRNNDILLQTIADLKRQLKQGDKNKFKVDIDLQKEITRKVTNDIFKEIKFIPNNTFLNDLQSRNSIGSILINMYNIPDDNKIFWWNTYKKTAKQALNKKRNSVNSAIQVQIMELFKNTQMQSQAKPAQYSDNNEKQDNIRKKDTTLQKGAMTFDYSDDEDDSNIKQEYNQKTNTSENHSARNTKRMLTQTQGMFYL